MTAMSNRIPKSKKRKTSPYLHQTQSEKIIHTYTLLEESQPSGQLITDMEDSIAAIESILRYNFNNKRLLEAALTHPSYTESTSYQHLEFVGDFVLGFAISNFVDLAYPSLDPGQLSLLRAANISTEKLARVAVRNGLYKYVRHRDTVLSDKVGKFVNVVEEEEYMVVHGGQMKAPKVLADIVESIIGAVFIDCGRDIQRLWLIIRHLLEPLVMLNVLEKQPQPITMLFEACQKEGKTVDIRHWRKGERNIASVFIDGRFFATGSSDNKENAKLQAAEVALSKLTRLINPNEGEVEGNKKKLHEVCKKKRRQKASKRYELLICFFICIIIFVCEIGVGYIVTR
ncbi:hypothetical protein LXL04_038351 [Taraxacum kok-saghyz]